MLTQFSRVAKQTSKRLTTLAAASVMAFSGLALAAPMFFAPKALAATANVSQLVITGSPQIVDVNSVASFSASTENTLNSAETVDAQGTLTLTTSSATGGFAGTSTSGTWSSSKSLTFSASSSSKSFYYKDSTPGTYTIKAELIDGALDQTATQTITVAAPCSNTPGATLVVNKTQSITNDPDSAVTGGNWALDNFSRHIQIWQHSDGTYCALATDNGNFDTTNAPNQISPQNGTTLTHAVTGTMVGSTYGEVSGGTFNASASLPDSIDCSVLASTCANGLTSYWVSTYFGGSANYDYGNNWDWTYTAPNGSAWTNSASGNTGDIYPVYDSTSGQGYDSIQAAVNGAAPDDTISIANGTYDEAINITKPLNLVGQSQGGVVVNQTAATPYGYGVSIVGINGVSISDMTFNTASGAPVNYALQAYQASNVSLTNLAFNGPGKTGLNSRGSKIGGVDINSSSNLSYDNVQVSSFSKNGFSVTAKYSTSDTASSNLSFSNISATGNNWAGLAFYNTNSSGSIASNITGVSFTGNNVFSGNGQGIFVEGDTDANFGAGNAARYGISAAGGGNVAIHNSTFSGNGQAIVNYQTNGLDASQNYWGNSTPDFNSLIFGNGVTTTPYFTNAAMTTRSDAKVLPDSSGNATANSTSPQVVVSSPSQPVNVTVTAGTSNASVDYSALVSGNTGTLPQTTITTPAATVSIPTSTTVTATGGTWNGTITAPTTTTVSLGSGKTVATAVEVGAGSLHLTFSNAVRLLLPGQANKLVGFVRNGDFTQIGTACTADDQATVDSQLSADGDCYINAGSDMVIWTKHFTTFVAYAPVSSSSSSSSSSTTPAATTTAASTSTPQNTNGSGAGSVQGQNTTANSGKTSSTSVEAPVANANQPKAAAREAGGIRWFWWVVVVVIALAAIGFGVYRYAEGTDEN